jgi:hypothetical protein
VIALLGVLVFFGAFAIDYADSCNTLAVSRLQAHGAARWSVMMAGLGACSVYLFIEVSTWLVVPELCGLYAGSWYAVSRARRATEVKRV